MLQDIHINFITLVHEFEVITRLIVDLMLPCDVRFHHSM